MALKLKEITTLEQLQALIDERVQEKLEQILGDPDEGLEVRQEVVDKLKAQKKSRNKRIPMEEVVKKYGLQFE